MSETMASQMPVLGAVLTLIFSIIGVVLLRGLAPLDRPTRIMRLGTGVALITNAWSRFLSDVIGAPPILWFPLGLAGLFGWGVVLIGIVVFVCRFGNKPFGIQR